MKLPKFTLFLISLLLILPLLSLLINAQQLNDKRPFYIIFKDDSEKIDILKNAFEDVTNPISKNYGKYWKPIDIYNLFEIPIEKLKFVKKWLNDNNIYDKEWENGGNYWKVITTIDKINKLFNVKMEWNEKYKIYHSKTNYQIPKHLKNIILFVEGISNHHPPLHYKTNNINKTNTNLNTNSNYNPDGGFVGLDVLQRLYNIPDDLINVNNMTACPVEFQGGEFIQSDLMMYQKMNNLNVNQLRENHIIGVKPDGSTLESQLDIQMLANANNSQLFFWNYYGTLTSGWMLGFTLDFINYTITNSTDYPIVLSISYGWAEVDQCDVIICVNETSQQYVSRSDIEFMKLGLIGISILVSSGDAGAPGRSEELCNSINPIYPGSSPYVTTVGATFINKPLEQTMLEYKTPLCNTYQCATGTTEYPTFYNYTGWTTGGGFELFGNNHPYWQYTIVDVYLNSTKLPPLVNFNINGRGYPDLSANGHNCAIFNYGNIENVDGTSCSAPIIASIIVMLNNYQQTRGNPTLGFLNPLLYFMYEFDHECFNDITQGTNAGTEYEACPWSLGFKSAKGWDPVTGLGTPNVEKMLKFFDFFDKHHKS
jgi:tripeptidyl-peptidase-1